MKCFRIPSSKSISNRLLIIRHLADANPCLIENLSEADDTIIMQELIESIENKDGRVLFAKNAGTVSRFIISLASVTEGSYIIDGEQRLRERPVSPLIESLRQLGGNIEYLETKGRLPIRVIGNQDIMGGEVIVDTSLSSQFLTSLLLVSPSFQSPTRFRVTGDRMSFPYINMTIELMREYGINIEIKEDIIKVIPGRYRFKKTRVEADWSSASFAYLYSYITNKELFVPDLNKSILQGDSIIKEFGREFGIETIFNENGGILRPSLDSPIAKNITLDMANNPDLFLPLVVLSAISPHKVSFQNLSTLVYKESNRLEASIINMKALGIKFLYKNNELVVYGNNKLNPNSKIISFNDHRVAMSFGQLALIDKSISLDNPNCVDKSFPRFWENINT